MTGNMDNQRSLMDKSSSFIGLDLKYFASGGFWLIFASVASALGGLLLSSLFSKLWPQDVYGQFTFLTSALGFISLTALPGMGQAITQAVSEGKEGVYKNASLIVAKWSIIGTLLLIAGSCYFYFRQNPNLAAATFASALAFPITTTASFYNSYLTGKKLFKQVAIFSTIAQYSSIIATALALYFLPTLAWVAFFSAWSTAIVNVILTLLALKKIKNETTDYKILEFGKHLSFSQMFPVGAEYFDRFVIPILLGFSTNAVYAFAILIPVQIHSFLKIFINLAQPKIVEIDNKTLHKDLFKKGFQLELLIFVVVLLYIVSAPYIFDVLYPEYKKDSLFISQIFSLSLLYFPGNLFGLGLIKKRSAKSIYANNVTYALVSILSLLILVPTFGILGAALSKIISRFYHAILQIYLFRNALTEHK